MGYITTVAQWTVFSVEQVDVSFLFTGVTGSGKSAACNLENTFLTGSGFCSITAQIHADITTIQGDKWD